MTQWGARAKIRKHYALATEARENYEFIEANREHFKNGTLFLYTDYSYYWKRNSLQNTPSLTPNTTSCWQ
ncbi:hypothetical protein AUJ65_03820 [Candidatus Micrarchaeota archaeon CG1_02_51_15]|nr:MAG: hypothetical protein AUJ65_03820 [Candidatus Micrarchaeota archaeon CG1_02_51_15]